MVEVDGLTKVYGNRVAIWKVSFQVGKGEILGFLGPNGAGKTTTMRIITGFVPASSGKASVAGFDVSKEPLEVKSRIGYLCETPPVYREMVVRSYLRFVAEIKRTPRGKRRGLVDRAIQLCGLEEVAGRVIGHLSKGYRQRVGLAQAILHEPDVLILDEPTSGLDPRQIIEIRERIRELGGEQTVILSTHILPEVTATCSRVVIINEGQIVAQDSTENLTAGLGKSETVRLSVGREDAQLKARLASLHGIQEVRQPESHVYLVQHDGGDATRERMAAEIVASGAGLLELSREKATLEEVFLQLVTDETGEQGEESAA
jgi:ABC-2 type transport system ATP-binding protein